jgi:hypothetical protein
MLRSARLSNALRSSLRPQLMGCTRSLSMFPSRKDEEQEPNKLTVKELAQQGRNALLALTPMTLATSPVAESVSTGHGCAAFWLM